MIEAGNIVIRDMEEPDAEFVLEIRNDLSTRDMLHNPIEFTVEQFSQWYNEERPWWFITSYEGEDFGYIRTNFLNRDDFSVQVGMDIHPNFRGKGLAKPSFKKLFSYLKGHGIDKVWLEVLEKNVLAFKIYKSLGFNTYTTRTVGSTCPESVYADEISICMARWI